MLLLCNTGSVITLSISLNLFKVVEDGYEFFAKRQLVTLFSAPNYCGEFDNAGGMMSVDETLMCSFQVKLILYFDRICKLCDGIIVIELKIVLHEFGICI